MATFNTHKLSCVGSGSVSARVVTNPGATAHKRRSGNENPLLSVSDTDGCLRVMHCTLRNAETLDTNCPPPTPLVHRLRVCVETSALAGY